MRSRLLPRTLAALLLLLPPLSPVAAAPPADELVIAVPGELGSLDMAQSLSDQAQPLLALAYQRLVERRTDPVTGKPGFVPALATKWTVEEGGTLYRFTLDPAARFDDGAKVTAAAVAASLMRVKSVGRAPAGLLAAVKSIEAPDEATLLVRLERPDATLIGALATPFLSIVNPAALAGDQASVWLSGHTAGSGPFRLTELARGQSYLLERNPHAPALNGGINRVRLTVVPDPAVRAAQLTKGDVDIAQGIPLELLPDLEKSTAVTVHSRPAWSFVLLFMNTERGVMADAKVRRGVAQSIDRAELVAGLYGGHARAMPGLLPPESLGYDPALRQPTYDADSAAKVLAPLGKPVDLIFANQPINEQLAVILQSYLGAAGLTVKLQSLATASWVEKVAKGDFDISLVTWNAGTPDPAFGINFWFDPKRTGAAGNGARYVNKPVADLLDQSLREIDEGKRGDLIRRALTLAVVDTPYVVLAQMHGWTVVRRDVQGYRFDPGRPNVVDIAGLSKSGKGG